MKEKTQKDIPPEVLENFITWFTKMGYNYDQVFRSSNKFQNQLFQQFMRQAPGKQKQLKLPF